MDDLPSWIQQVLGSDLVTATLITAALAWIIFRAFQRAADTFLFTRGPGITMNGFWVERSDKGIRLYGSLAEVAGVPVTLQRLHVFACSEWRCEDPMERDYEQTVVFEYGPHHRRQAPSQGIFLGEIDLEGIEDAIAALQPEPLQVATFAIYYEYSVTGGLRHGRSATPCIVYRDGRYRVLSSPPGDHGRHVAVLHGLKAWLRERMGR